MTKVIDHIHQAKGKTLFSFEILPPLKGASINDIFQTIEPLMQFDPKFIDVTYHREEYIYKKRDNGLLEKVSTRKRPGTVGICAAILNKFHIDTVPHIICGGFTKEETENALIDLQFLGIDNILALRGDPIKSESTFLPTEGGHRYASDLIKQVQNLNRGVYLNSEVENDHQFKYCVGVAGYPEKHFESPNMDLDLKYLKQKVDAGADYIVTQMFFDNQKYFEFERKCREFGIQVPIIAGLKPLTRKNQLTKLASFFHIDLPDDLVNAVMACKNDEEVREVGIQFCIAQSKELIKHKVPGIHYYTMGRSKDISEIVKAAF